ncbi:MAG: hypothetical protein K2H90_02815, partial [Oscillospiraceae bacterium]|nr:hypothetical protein [Oscillospiraceae bacterium]
MTKEEWTEAENEMSTPYGMVDLKIDEYDVSLRIAKNGNLKYCIAVYVNGYIKGEWALNDCEIRRKFYRCSTKSAVSKKEKDKIFKGVSKKRREEFEAKNYDLMHYKYYEPYFSSFKTLKSH